MAIRNELLDKFIRLTKKKRELAEEAKRVNDQLSPIQEALVEQFADTGTQSVSRDGMTVYVSKKIWAGASGDKDEMLSALVSNPDTAFLVKPACNSMQLSAFVREFPQDPDTGLPQIPDYLKDHLKVSEIYTVSARKAAK